MQNFSLKSIIFSFTIILAIVAFWIMQIQILNQKTTPMNFSSFTTNKNVFLGETAKHLFSSIPTSNNANVNLVGIIHNIYNADKSYIILNIDGKNAIYRIGQDLPNLGKLTAINKQDIDFEKQGNIEKLFISQAKSATQNNSDINYTAMQTNILPQPPNNLPEPIIYGAEQTNANSINNQAMDNYVPQNQGNQGVNEDIAQPLIAQPPSINPN